MYFRRAKKLPNSDTNDAVGRNGSLEIAFEIASIATATIGMTEETLH